MAQNKNYNNRTNNNRNNNRSNNRDNRNRNNNRNYNNRNQNNKSQYHKNQNRDHQGNNQKQEVATTPKVETQSKTESSNDLLIFTVFLIALASFFLFNKFYLSKQPNSLYSKTNTTKFMKEGKLTFLNTQTEDPIISIDIEIAKSTYEIEKGLMHRRALPANAGMLFIFDEAHYRTFWMKNTYLSLDILFLDADKKIFRISKNAQPLSERSIPSGGKAMYVVEVLAGFTDAYQIHVGDRIEFSYR